MKTQLLQQELKKKKLGFSTHKGKQMDAVCLKCVSIQSEFYRLRLKPSFTRIVTICPDVIYAFEAMVPFGQDQF